MNIRTISAQECRDVAELLERAIARHEIRCPGGSDLDRMVKACRWMGRFPDDAIQPDAAFAADSEQAKDAFPLFEQARRVASAVTWTEEAPGLTDRMRFLRKRFDRLKTQDSKSQDAIFEIEVAGRLARTGLHVEFSEPDIVVSAGHERLALACKRPRREAAIADVLRGAAQQIEAQSEPGIIVVGIEAIFHRRDNGVIGFSMASDAEFAEETRVRLDALLVDVAPSMQRAFQTPQVLGVLYCGVVTAWSKQPSAYLYRWLRRHVPNLGAPTPALVGIIEDLMFEVAPPKLSP